MHHIVEQSQADPKRSGFSVERINTTDNMTRIPTPIHQDISAHYSRHMPGSKTRLRDALDGETWEYQADVGRDTLDRATKEHDDDGR